MATIGQLKAEFEKLKEHKIVATFNVKVEPVFQKEWQKKWRPKRMAALAEEFLEKDFIPYLLQDFDTAANSNKTLPHLAAYEGGEDALLTRDSGEPRQHRAGLAPNAGRMRMGQAAIRSVFKKTGSVTDGDFVGAGAGPTAELYGLKNWPYMPVAKSPRGSHLTSLWLTVEFGTGIAANVGGEAYVNETGWTKDPDRNDGSWWYPMVGSGMLFTGQKGVFWLSNTNRTPKDFSGALRARFMDFLRKRL